MSPASSKGRLVEVDDDEGADEESKYDDEVDDEDDGKRMSKSKSRRQRASTTATDSSAATRPSVDGVWQGKLSMMRRRATWDDIPMEFFIDKFVGKSLVL